MKRLMTNSLALMCLFMLISPVGSRAYASASSPTAGTVTTFAIALNVRGGPSTSDAVIGKLPRGSTVTLYEKKSGWWRVGLPGGTYGYCTTDYIKEVSGSAARNVATKLNVRGGPSTSYPVQTVLPRGTVVVKFSASGDFVKIVYNGTKTGYVNASYLSSSGGSTPSAQQKYPAISLGVPNYKQTDSRWSSVKVGASGRTIAQIGCATTALAMTESYRTGTSVTPSAMESRLSYTSGGSLYWPSNYITAGAVSYAAIYEKLQNKIPVIIGARNASGGTHFVVVKGYAGGNSLTASGFLINDPGSSSRTTLADLLSAYPTIYRAVRYTK